jgi:hypothetical protein
MLIKTTLVSLALAVSSFSMFQAFKGSHATHYLYDLEKPSDVQPIIESLRTAGSNDKITIFINSRGGYVYLLDQIRNARLTTAAEVKTYCESLCLSAGAQVLFMGDNIDGAPNSIVLIHRSYMLTPIGKVLNPLNDSSEIAAFKEMLDSGLGGCLNEFERGMFFKGEDVVIKFQEFKKRQAAGQCNNTGYFQQEYDAQLNKLQGK